MTAIMNDDSALRTHLRRAGLSDTDIETTERIAEILPFRVSQHVLENLIDWSDASNDPIYRLYFPHPEMLGEAAASYAKADIEQSVSLNPHPAGQVEQNLVDDIGVQHKYADTVLVFPPKGQTCHSYCAYCFRWAQFVEGEENHTMKSASPESVGRYLDQHKEIRNVLFTGGDPFVMGAKAFTPWLREVLDPRHESIDVVRIGTKAPLSKPGRFFKSGDADALLKLLEEVSDAGKQLAIMLHVSHPRELESDDTQKALRALRSAGGVLYSQAPVVRHVNDSAQVWLDKWRLESRLGILPYYMFVERDTGPWEYFAIPLMEALGIFRTAQAQAPGLARTIRGPVMSTAVGKLHISTTTDTTEELIKLSFVRSRLAEREGTHILAHYDDKAKWVSELHGVRPEDSAILEEASA
jgi:L-lysine 2,3-aminomutase